jgi:fused signal recognition particle receptor
LDKYVLPESTIAASGSLFDKLLKTRKRLSERLSSVISGKAVIDLSLLEGLEEILLASDIGVETTEQLLERLKREVDLKTIQAPEQLKAMLKEEMISYLKAGLDKPLAEVSDRSFPGIEVIMFVGVNGVGKTTAIAKMAHRFRGQGQTVLLVAADTFRAAAIEQLEVWASRVGAQVVRQQRGADPAAVVYDGLSAAQAKGIDKVLIDTAGRLHTKYNLMEELKKVRRIAGHQLSGAPHKITLVLDATTGQNAIAQAREFSDALGVTDIILTKLDGTAKGGIVVAISRSLGIPISFICTGEKLEDFEVFQAREFVEAIFA